MRRPHRSIEVFDISLMAVVTKAMGAFLVLMLLLMPYYKSGPIGQQAADDLRKKVAEVTKNVQDVMSKLTGAGAEDLRRLLDEALKQLEEASKLITELQRANDALNSQVQRLEGEKEALSVRIEDLQRQLEEARKLIAELRRTNDALNSQVRRLQDEKAALAARVEELQRQLAALLQRIAQLEAENKKLNEGLDQLNGNFVTGLLHNWDCPDVAFTIGLWDNSITLVSDGRPVNFTEAISLGYDKRNTEQQILIDVPAAKSDEPGKGIRLNSASFSYRGAQPGIYKIVVTTRTLEPKTLADNRKVFPLKKPASACSVLISLEVGNRSGRYDHYYPRMITFPKSEYAIVYRDLKILDNDSDIDSPSQETLTWLKSQVERADKER